MEYRRIFGHYLVIYAGLFDLGVHQMFRGPIFESRNQVLQLSSSKIWVNFSKICIKINKILKNSRENSRENAIVSENFLISGGNMGKIMKIIWTAIMGCSLGGPPKVEKISRNL